MNLSNKTAFFVLFLATVLTRLTFSYLTGFTADDALITFRYAENLVSGQGFVYNAGERVLGTTTPLFTFVLAIFLLFKMSAANAALFVSVICSGVTAAIIYRFSQYLRFTNYAFLPALAYILWPRSIVADTSGMETAFFTLLIFASWYFQYRQLRYYAVGLATLACVTRPEGFLLLGILLVLNFYKDNRNFISYLLTPALIILPWLVFSYFYFGTIVPSSVTGKLALYSHISTDTTWGKVVYLLGLHNVFGWAMLTAAICGGWWLNQKQNFGKAEIIWLVGMIAFFTFSKTALFFWYVVPIYPMYIIFSTAAIPFLRDKFGDISIRFPVVRIILAIVISLGLLYMSYSQVIYYKDYARYLNEVHKSIGKYLEENARPGDVVAARYIGNTGYYSNLKILDRDGMVTPEAAAYNREGNYIGLILAYQPEWVVAAHNREGDEFIESNEFLMKYRLVKTFGWEERVNHDLYRKID